MRAKSLSALLVSSALAVSALATSAAAAGLLRPGLWSLGGIQTICLKKDGTWTGVSFSPWGGKWQNMRDIGAKAIIFGNFNAGADNDSIVVGPTLQANWNEWPDNLNLPSQGLKIITLSFVSAPPCPAPAAATASQHPRPMD
jgi:hypothetical protein